jgi:hypothetical protein
LIFLLYIISDKIKVIILWTLLYDDRNQRANIQSSSHEWLKQLESCYRRMFKDIWAIFSFYVYHVY